MTDNSADTQDAPDSPTPLDYIVKSCDNSRNDRQAIKAQAGDLSPRETLAIIPQLMDDNIPEEKKKELRFLFGEEPLESSAASEDDENDENEPESLPPKDAPMKEEELSDVEEYSEEFESTRVSSEEEDDELSEEENPDDDKVSKVVKSQREDYSALHERINKLLAACVNQIALDTVTINMESLVNLKPVDPKFPVSKIPKSFGKDEESEEDVLTPSQVASVMEACHGCDIRLICSGGKQINGSDEEDREEERDKTSRLFGFDDFKDLEKHTSDHVTYDHILFPVRGESFFYFLTACVYKTCMKNREKNKLKENQRIVTRSNHPVLTLCKDRQAYDNFFEGCEKGSVKFEGFNSIWSKMKKRVSNPKSGMCTHPLGHVCDLMGRAHSISWCEGTLPVGNNKIDVYCAVTGRKLEPGQKVHVVNVRTSSVSGAVLAKPPKSKAKKKEEKEHGKGAKVKNEEDDDTNEKLPTAEIKNNCFFVTSTRDNPAPFAVIELMTSLVQVDLLICNDIEKWLEKHNDMIPENCESQFVADLLLMEQEIFIIAEWYSYVAHLCYVLDNLVPHGVYREYMPRSDSGKK